MIWWLLGGALGVGIIWWLIRVGAGLFLLEAAGEVLEGLADCLGDISFD